MTSVLSPLPLGARLPQALGMSRVGVPDFPTRLPDRPAPPASFDVPPFGETDTLPPEPPKVEIPPMRAPDAAGEAVPDYTDQDLADAIRPLIADVLPTRASIDPVDLESVMRAAFRRALAEHAVGPFDRPGFVQRCLWRFDALLSSRSYDEILHDKTRRFRVEEVYLYEKKRLSLVSFASIDPARHTSARKASQSAQRIAIRLRDKTGTVSTGFPFEKGRRVLIRTGRHTYLAALTRGMPDALARADLDYALQRIEEHFHQEFEHGSPLLQEIQPLLEECLLIHSPVPPVSF